MRATALCGLLGRLGIEGLMTVGWILEGDRDRFLSARDPTPAPAPVVPSFQCPFCKDTFSERKHLNAHAQVFHVVKRPFLLIAGVEPGAEDVIRQGVSSLSLETFNCTEVAAGFNGEPVQPIRPALLARRLRSLRKATVRLWLLNSKEDLIQPVAQEYRLRFLAPDEVSLSKVDELFLAELGVEEVDLDKVALFYEATRDGVAAEYAEALADYVRAVLLKDGDPRTGVSARLHHYHEIQSRALHALQLFERPLAKLLCALIRFGLNDFSQWRKATGFADLDHACFLLGPLAQDDQLRAEDPRSARGRRNNTVFVCPVDVGTDTVTRLAKQTSELSRWGAAAEEQFSALSERASLDSLDSAKIRALWGAVALRLGATTSAERALRLLDGDPTFGNWAARKLAKG